MNPQTSSETVSRPRVGVSACLLGQNVRFDGGHRRDAWIHEDLARLVELVPVCPEVESGLPVPRESRRRVEALAEASLDGFLLKKGSPSCGVERVRVYPEQEGVAPRYDGRGLFAATLARRLPHLPLSEEGWLHDEGLREAFLEQVFTHHRLRREVLEREGGASLGALIEFHAAHKFLYLAHSPRHYRALGNLVGTAGERPLAQTLERYRLGAMEALAIRPTPGKQVNVLHHIVGYFKGVLTDEEKHELLEHIEGYRQGLHQRVVPLTLLGHHLRRHRREGWLARQVYFRPYPLELVRAR